MEDPDEPSLDAQLATLKDDLSLGQISCFSHVAVMSELEHVKHVMKELEHHEGYHDQIYEG